MNFKTFGLLLLLPGTGVAEIIAPVDAFASSYYPDMNTTAIRAVDGSGLSGVGHLLTQSHTAYGNGYNAWIATSGPAEPGAPVIANQYIVFDLGGYYDLSDAYIWQFVQGALVDRGLADFRLLAASSPPTPDTPPPVGDLTGYTEILSRTTLAKGVAHVAPVAQQFTLTNATNVRQVYLQIYTGHAGVAQEYVGLSEIRFTGERAAPTDYRWKSSTNANWASGSSWEGDAVPTGNVNAVFDVDAQYAVMLTHNPSPEQITVSNGVVHFFNDSPTGLNVNELRINGGHVQTADLRYGTSQTSDVFRYQQLHFTSGILEIRHGQFSPQQAAFQTGGFALAETVVLNGEIGSPDRPTYLFTEGGSLFAHPTATAAVVGANGGKVAVIVDGEGSNFQTYRNGGIVVGSGTATLEGAALRADGTLTLRNGGSSATGNFYAGAYGGIGRIEIDNGSLTAYGTTYIGYENGEGHLSISNNGKSFTETTAYIGTFGGMGSAAVSGTGSRFDANTQISVGYGTSSTGVRASGTLVLRDGAVASAPTIRIGSGGGEGHVVVGAAGGIDSGGTALLASGSLAIGYGGGERAILEVNAGGRVEAGAGIHSNPSWNDGAINLILDGGVIKTTHINAYAGHFLQWRSGTLWLTGGTTSIGRSTQLPVVIPQVGTLMGHGRITPHVQVLGTLTPGDEADPYGTFDLRNGLTAGSTPSRATFEMNLRFGIFDVDRIDVSGSVSLANAGLRLSLEDPTPGTMDDPIAFLLITNDGTDAVEGRFAFVDLGAEYEDLFFYIDYAFSGTAVNGIGTGNDVAIVFIPEPSTWLLFTSATAGWVLLRRRRLAAARSETLCA